ncbi:MAG: hypothetical protein R3C16_06475 [Hyphomonadaceae bacterium]
MGLIVQFGGQTPLDWRNRWPTSAPILGTSVDAVDLAEDRDRFQALLRKIGEATRQLNCRVARRRAARRADRLSGHAAPEHVLGGLAMRIVHSEEELEEFASLSSPTGRPDRTRRLRQAAAAGRSLHLRDAIEVDVDAICDGTDVFVAGVMEHIEETGVHSGDARLRAAALLASKKLIDEIEDETKPGVGARCARADQHSVRGEGRRDLHSRSQSARLAHSAVRGEQSAIAAAAAGDGGHAAG